MSDQLTEHDPQVRETGLLNYDFAISGELGFASRDEYLGYLAGQGMEERFRTRAWQHLLRVSIRWAKEAKAWESPIKLMSQMRIADLVIQGPRNQSGIRERAGELKKQIQARMEGQEQGVPPAHIGPRIGRPFMFVPGEGDSLVPAEAFSRGAALTVSMNLGNLYRSLAEEADMSRNARTFNQVTEQRLIGFLNLQVLRACADPEIGTMRGRTGE